MSSQQASISVAFLIIGVLIAAKHTDKVAQAVTWAGKPIAKKASGG